MSFQLGFTIALTIFMAVSFIVHKWPFGLTTMTCCVLLVISGILDIPTAFSGFGNKIVVLIAPMLVMGTALTKTSLVSRVQVKLNALQKKRGMALLLGFYAAAVVFVQFIPTTATIAIFVTFLATLDDEGEITPGRILLPLLALMEAWKFKIPIGLGATTFAQINAYAEGIITDENHLVSMMDPFIVTLIPTIALTIYCIFCWKLMPKDHKIGTESVKAKDYTSKLTKGQEYLTYIVFVCVMAVMVLNKWTGNYLYIAPAAGVLVLIYGGVISVKEAVHDMTCDMIWMIAGVLVMASALSSTGVADLIGNGIISILGEQPNSFLVMLLFTGVTIFMTAFISNSACVSVLIPLAASVCAAGGWDPRGIMIAVQLASVEVVAFPSGSGEAAVCYAAGNYNPAKVLKFTLPYTLIAWFTIALSANIFFPIYG